MILWLFLGTSREGLAWGGWGWGVWGEVEGREVPLGWEEGGVSLGREEEGVDFLEWATKCLKKGS